MKKENRRRNISTFNVFFVIIISLLTLNITGCNTYENVITPPFPVTKPVRPILKYNESGDIPSAMQKNLILLMEYAEEMEIYIEGMEKYYGI